MIIAPDETEIITTNISDEGFGFKIDNDSHVMFEGLRKTLYPSPIKAISREISINARDTMIASGKKNVPIKIYLPGEYLVVSDEGEGISPDRIEHVVCWYGRSSKRSDNSQVGGFGLGLKSIWSYCDSFVIDTRFDGMHYIYNAVIDESGKGRLLCLDKSPTKLPNSTAIKIPVLNNDRWAFKEQLKYYTKFWDTPPEFVGYPPEEKFVPTLKGDKWAIYLKDIGNCNVLVDGVPYEDRDFNIPKRVVLTFKTGQASLVLNRDSLRYDEKTKTAIKEALASYDKEVTEVVQKDLNKLTSFAEVIGIIESLPKAHEQREWLWNGEKFNYPLIDNVSVYERPRNKLSSYRTRTFGTTVKENSFIELDKDEVTSYDRQRISTHLKSNSLSRVFLLEKDHKLPVQAVGLSTIKVDRPKGVKRGPKAPKTTIKGRLYNGRKAYDYLIETPTVTVYTTEDINSIKGSYSFPVNIVQIAEKDESLIEDEDNWITVDEYVQQNIYDKLTPEEIQAEADRQEFSSKYSNFDFLANDPDFKLLKENIKNKKIDGNMESLISWLVSTDKVKPVIPDIYNRFPLLKHLRYMSSKDEYKNVKEYIELIRLKEKTNVTSQSNSLALA